MQDKKKIVLILLLIICSGIFLRLYKIGFQSFWNPELQHHFYYNANNLSGMINRMIYCNYDPPLYYILMYYFQKIAGTNLLLLRALSALFNALSIFLIFVVAKKLYSFREGLMSAALMSVLWCPIFYAQQARQISLLILLTLFSSYCFILVYQDLKQSSLISLKKIILFTISSILLIYVHYFGLLFVILQAIGLLLSFAKNKRALKYIITSFSFTAITYIPWIKHTLFHISAGGSDFIATLNKTRLADFLQYLKFIYNNSNAILAIVLILYLFYVSKKIYEFIRIKNAKMSFSLDNPDFFVLLWLTAPFLIVYLKSTVSFPMFMPKYLIISLPAAYILLARSFNALPFSSAKKAIIFTTFIFLLISHLFAMNYYTNPVHAQWRESAYYVADKYNDSYSKSLLIHYCYSTEFNYSDLFDYYFKERNFDKSGFETLGREYADGISIEEVRSFVKKRNIKYVWILNSENGGMVPDIPFEYKDYDKEFIDSLKNEYKLQEHKVFWRAHVWIFRTDEV
ncbi:MAG: glycosyltransferase family 39 protein [Endomicrobiales bacterium]|nr:glycosyltransferase family 39 protein [Endomicrobiales bacterium]